MAFPLLIPRVLGILIVLCLSYGEETGTQCIKNYQELKNCIVNNSENAENLLASFYPPNRSPAHALIVYYYIASVADDDKGNDDTVLVGNETHPNFENPNVTADHIFQWLDSSTLLLTEFRLFQALTFGIAQLETGQIDIKVDQPFCNPDREIELLNLVTIWLKTFTVHELETEYYYSMYFNDEKFVVVGNSIRDSTFALVLFEYFASIGALAVIYTILVLCRYETFAPLRKRLSDISIPCFVFTWVILIKDMYSYSMSFQYVSKEWYRAFPIPYIFPLFAVVNVLISIIITIIIGPKFEVPALLKVCTVNVMCLKGRFYNSLLQVILVFSITSFTVLITFHFAWVVLAFSAYPVRCLASQAFAVPLIVVCFVIYFAINYVLSSPSVVIKMKERSKRVAVVLVSSFFVLPFLIALLGVLYYYSQVLIDVNDSQNYPIKTVIAGVVPTIVTALGAVVIRNTLKAYGTVLEVNPFDNSTNDDGDDPISSKPQTRHGATSEGEDDGMGMELSNSATISKRKQKHTVTTMGSNNNNSTTDSDEEMLPIADFDVSSVQL